MNCSNVIEAGINAHQNLHRAFKAVRSGQTDSWLVAATTVAVSRGSEDPCPSPRLFDRIRGWRGRL